MTFVVVLNSVWVLGLLAWSGGTVHSSRRFTGNAGVGLVWFDFFVFS